MCRLWTLNDVDSAKIDDSNDAEISIRSSILTHSQFPCERFKDVTSVTWSPDGQLLATGCYDGMARIWDNQGNLKKELKEHTGPVFSLKWNRTGNLILSGSYDRRAIVWDAATGQPIKSFLLHSAPVLDVDWKDSDTFATCSSDMAIFICKVSSPRSEATRHLQGHTDEVNAVCWSPGGTYLASCSDDGAAKIWSEDGLLHNLQGHTKEIYTVRWTLTGPGSANPDKPLLLCTASFDGTVKVWNAVSGALVHNLQRQMQPVYSIAPSPNGDCLATGSLGGYVCVWNMADGNLVSFKRRRFDPRFSSLFLRFVSHTTCFLSSSPLAQLPLQIQEMRGNGDTFDVSWSFDGALLCSCFSSGALSVIGEYK
jgi:transducin (beta)-like 1